MDENPREQHFYATAQLMTSQVISILTKFFDTSDWPIGAIREEMQPVLAGDIYDIVEHTIDSIQLHYAVYQPREEYKPEDIPNFKKLPLISEKPET